MEYGSGGRVFHETPPADPMRPRLLLQAALLAAAILPPALNPSGNGPLLAFGSAAHADDGGDGDGGDGGGDGGSGGEGGGGGGNDIPPVPSRFLAGDAASTEIVAASVTPAQLIALTERGFRVLEQRGNTLLPRSAVRLRVPLRLTIDQAIAEVERLNPASVADRNHYYRYAAGGCDGPHCTSTALIAWPARADGRRCSTRARIAIGLIDTAVDRTHPALAGQPLETIELRGADLRPSSAAHGTAVASLLLGAAASSEPGLLRDTRVTAVDAFHRGRLGDERMDAFDLVAAIDTLVRRKVRVLNLSFAGPPNKLLERSVRAADARGVVLVAAVGNDGARSVARYPAGYEPVIAVTAVAPDRSVYRRAVQGGHVDLSAPGVDVWTAKAGAAGGARQTGTSFAAPFVTAAAALLIGRDPSLTPDAVRRALRAGATDLGDPGDDPVFGAGLLNASSLCGPSARKAAIR